MSTLFLIGNGFDINCGMKTRYTDVYKKYIKEESLSDNIKKFKRAISGDFENWGDFEMAMGKYAQDLYNEKAFLECVRDFASYMEEYLIKENNGLKDKLKNEQVYSAVIKEFRRSLNDFYTEISHNIDKIMKQRNAAYLGGLEAISFNYTDIFDVFWAAVMQNYNNKEIIHIHGILGDGPVFGVDNIEQIKANYNLSRKGKRGFIKPIFNDEYDEERVNKAKQRIRNALTICTYGMSLGESDLTWRNEIIDWLRNDVDHHLFVYKYSFSKATFSTVPEKLDIEDEAKEQLLYEWGISDTDDIFKQIHIPCGKNLFNIEAVLKEKVEFEERLERGKNFIEKNAQNLAMA